MARETLLHQGGWPNRSCTVHGRRDACCVHSVSSWPAVLTASNFNFSLVEVLHPVASGLDPRSCDGRSAKRLNLGPERGTRSRMALILGRLLQRARGPS